MNYQQYIWDKTIQPVLFQQYLNSIPRWRRPWVRLGRAYRKFTYEKIEFPWGTFLIQFFYPTYCTPNTPARAWMDVHKSRKFKMIERFLWSPIHYALHPMLIRKLSPKITREWRKSWLRTATAEDKMRDWERRMLKGGPMPNPPAVRTTKELWENIAKQLPTDVFEETAYTMAIQNPGFGHGLGFVVALFNASDVHQGFLYDNNQILIYKTRGEAVYAGETFLSGLQAKKKELADEQQRLSEQAIWGAPNV